MYSNPKLTKILSGICCSLVLASCSDTIDLPYPSSPNGENTLTIYLPNVEGAARFGATRGDEFQNTRAGETASEATINDLWFFAFPTEKNEETQGLKVAQKLLVATNGHNYVGDNNPYTSYKVNLTKGNYHIYLLANMNDYIEVPGGRELEPYLTNLSEDNLKTLILNFSTDKYLKENNLPMACLFDKVKNASQNIPQDNIIPFDSSNTEIYADLTFLCSKVRYTILFDKDASDNTFTTTDIDFTSPKASNVIPSVALTSEGNVTYTEKLTLDNLSIEQKNYPATDSQYLLEDRTEYEEDLTDYSENKWDSETQKAWQGTIYLPENPVEGDARTLLSFTATGTEANTDADHYQLPLFYDKKLERGKFYDAVARINTADIIELPVTLTVSDWTTQSLAYSLHGPYELIVEKTENVPVSTGVYGIVGYSSDTQVSFESPKIEIKVEGEAEPRSYDLFTIGKITPENIDEILEKSDNGTGGRYESLDYDAWPEYLYITVNQGIPAKDMPDLDEVGDKKYFHIKAGNLYKKIGVNPLKLDSYFNVTPNVINISVREYTSSGTDDAVIKISYNTNIIANNILLVDDLAFTDNDNTYKGIVKINEEAFGRSISLTGDADVITSDGTPGNYLINNKKGNNKGDLYLNLYGITKGGEIWQNVRKITLHFSVEDPKTGKTLTQQVEINIEPFSFEYTIHFRSIDDTWAHPHIYVYQCLELPSDLADENGVLLPQAGKSVGYDVGDNFNAGREYAFTNGVAFKGWYGYGGPKINDPYAPGKFDSMYDTFWVFDTDNGHSYDASASTDMARYYRNMNFNAKHRASATASSTASNNEYGWNCDYCRDHSDQDIPEWPGMAMEKENIGGEIWYKYTLSGVATPGKALIMFTSEHSDQNGMQRYPKGNEIGVPLFDYPDREGWFLYDPDYDSFQDRNVNHRTRDDLKFTDNKPEAVRHTFKTGEKVIIRWFADSYGKTFNWLHYGNNGGWTGGNWGIRANVSEGYCSYELNVDDFPNSGLAGKTYFECAIHDGIPVYNSETNKDEPTWANGPGNNFVIYCNDIYDTYDADTRTYTVDLKYCFEPGDHIRFKWNKNNTVDNKRDLDYIYIWWYGPDDPLSASWPGNMRTGTNGSTNYYDLIMPEGKGGKDIGCQPIPGNVDGTPYTVYHIEYAKYKNTWNGSRYEINLK